MPANAKTPYERWCSAMRRHRARGKGSGRDAARQGREVDSGGPFLIEELPDLFVEMPRIQLAHWWVGIFVEALALVPDLSLAEPGELLAPAGRSLHVVAERLHGAPVHPTAKSKACLREGAVQLNKALARLRLVAQSVHREENGHADHLGAALAVSKKNVGGHGRELDRIVREIVVGLLPVIAMCDSASNGELTEIEP